MFFFLWKLIVSFLFVQQGNFLHLEILASWALRPSLCSRLPSKYPSLTWSLLCVSLLESAFTLHANSSWAVEFDTCLAPAISLSSLALPWTAALAASHNVVVAAATIRAWNWQFWYLDWSCHTKTNAARKCHFSIENASNKGLSVILNYQRSVLGKFVGTRKDLVREALSLRFCWRWLRRWGEDLTLQKENNCIVQEPLLNYHNLAHTHTCISRF